MSGPLPASSKRSAPTNNIQKNMLIEYMEQNPKLRAGTFGPDFTFKNAQTLWEIIGIKLNAVPGGARKDDWRMWRKTWADMKKNATSKAVRYKKETQKTGGGTPPKNDINDEDIMILDLISPKKIEGISQIPESEVLFKFDDTALPDEIVIENEQDEAQPSLIEEGHQQKSSRLTGPEDEAVATADDHQYSIPGPGGRTKKQRLQTSLELSKQMINQVEFKNNVKNDYYKKKIAYLDYKMRLGEENLELSKEKLKVSKENLKVLQENLKVNSTILKIIANKK